MWKQGILLSDALSEDKVVVTGVCGFLGSFIAERLLKDGHHVVGLDNLFRGDLRNLEILREYSDRFQFFNADITNENEILPEMFRGASSVFHYASINGSGLHFYEQPLDILRVNVLGSVNIFEAAVRSSSVKKIVFASSGLVYGQPTSNPRSEDVPLAVPNASGPNNSYALSKMIGESYLLSYAKKYDLEYLIFRIFDTYGPRMDSSAYDQFLTELMRKFLFEEEILLPSDSGQIRRSFCFIDDSVEMAIRSFQKLKNETLNLGGDGTNSILDLAVLLHKVSSHPFDYGASPKSEWEIGSITPDITRIVSETGYSPKVSLEEGLSKTLRWFAQKWHIDLGPRGIS